jgi:hypothetical protein
MPQLVQQATAVAPESPATGDDVVVLAAARPPMAVAVTVPAATLCTAVAFAAAASMVRSAPIVAGLLLGVVAALFATLAAVTALLRPTEVRLAGCWVGVRGPFSHVSWCDLRSVTEVSTARYGSLRPRASNGGPTAFVLWASTPHGPGMSRLVARVARSGRSLPGVRHDARPPMNRHPFVVPCGELRDPTALVSALDRRP